MGIITKEVEVVPSGKMIQHYKNKGYNAEYHKPLLVKVEDLSSGSRIKIEARCDYCGEIKTIQYCDYLKSLKLGGTYSCVKCAHNKAFETNLSLYGSASYSSTKECRDKVKKTNLERYGVENCAKLEEVKEKTRNTNLQRYGCEHTLQSNVIREKGMQTCLKKYGVEYALQSPDIREKGMQSYYRNSSQMTSRQQLYLCNLYGGKLNYPVKYYNADICFPDEKFAIEFDGNGHDLCVKTGKVTQEEFKHKEIVRNLVFKNEGYKQMRIISQTNKLPSDLILFQMLSDAKQYFSNTNHSWLTYDIDKSLLFNAEHKDGVPYSFGSLRTVKEPDLQLNN